MILHSLLLRLACSPAWQAIYARVRRIPLIGLFSHTLVSRILPRGTKVTVLVREGLGAGLRITVDPRYESDYINGLYEPALQKSLVVSLERGQVFYDIGAHIGFISLLGARLVGPEGKVYAFEADPANASRVSHHAELNCLSQIELIQSAVWSEYTVLAFQRDSGSSSGNRGSVVGVGETRNISDIVSVGAITVDAFAFEHLPPALIKIDVEGAESEVLKGADRVAREVKPTIICEIHNANAEAYVFRWLADRGYQLQWLGGADSFPRCLVAQSADRPGVKV